MAHYNQNWDDLGRNIQDIVDRAVNLQDYQKLNQTITQVVDKAIDRGSAAVRRAVDGAARHTPKAAPRPQPQAVTVEPARPLPVLYAGTGKLTAKGILKIVGGGFVTAFSLLSLVAVGVLNLVAANTGWIPVALGLSGLGAGGSLIGSGVGTLSRIGRFKAYCKTLGEKTHCTLEKLAGSVGKSEKYVRKELQKMIGDGLFLQGHMDKEQTRLITSHETYRQFEQSRLQLEQRQRQEAALKIQKAEKAVSPQVQEVLDRGDAYIAQIHRCNDAIPGAQISEKISRIEMTVQHIFDRAEAHPEIIPDLKKMMDYYLPMTVKLLNAYAEMDAQSVQGENILTAKQEIEDTLDTLNLAFEKLMDDLFEDTALDVSSDISVLKTLLAQEGLTDDGLCG